MNICLLCGCLIVSFLGKYALCLTVPWALLVIIISTGIICLIALQAFLQSVKFKGHIKTLQNCRPKYLTLHFLKDLYQKRVVILMS